MKKRVYSLFVAIAMIVGIVIGSGIYFKADDILGYTGGNIYLGVLVLVIGSLNIIFGSLALSEIAIKTNETGGIFEYYKSFVNKDFSVGIGWFNTFVYFPSIACVVAWVSGIYICDLIKISNTLENQVLIGIIVIFIFSILNILSRYLSGQFQFLSTIIKLIPLFIIGFLGLVLKPTNLQIPSNFTVVTPTPTGLTWIASLVPIAFTYDGWSLILNITTEIKNPEKNIKKALIIGPLLILSSYLIFFIGISKLLSPTFIMSVKDLSIQYALSSLFSNKLSSLFFIVIIISILGVVNGVVLTGARLPQALAEKKMIPFNSLAKIDEKLQVSIKSSILFMFICFIWMLIHYLTQKYKILGNSDVSEISVVFFQIIYLVLYIFIMINYKKGKLTNKNTSFYSPIISILCCILVVLGSIILSPVYGSLFLIFCLIICLLGYTYSKVSL